MKTRLTWIHVTATAAIVAGATAPPAAAQYAPYRPIPQQPAAAPQPAAPPTQPAAAQTPYMAWQQSQVTAPYRPAAAQAPQTVAPYGATAPYVPAQAQSPAPQNVSTYPAGYPTYPAVARQPNGTAPTPSENERMPPPQNGQQNNGGPNGYEPQNGQAAGGEVQNGHSPSHAANGYTTNGYAANGYAAPGGCYPATTGYHGSNGYVDYGVSNYFDDCGHQSQWFGGIYFLYMERDNASPVKLTVEVDHGAVAHPYYPPATTTVVSTHQADHDFREGIEVRFGSTFTIGDACDAGCYTGCNSCAPCPPTVFAWEAAWWGINDDEQEYTFTDDVNGMPRRIYGMKNFVGVEYDRDGAGGVYAYRPVNEYYGYALPIQDPGAGPYPDGYLAVLAQHVRTNFRAQNLELNIIRFPVCDVACGGCNSGCGSDYGLACGCEEPCCPSAFSMYGSCGVRYFRVEDEFMYANEFTEWTGGTPGKNMHDGFYDDESDELYYDIQVDNHLVGPQVGWTMNYCYGCKWNFFCNSTFGMFNNHVEHMQQMWGGGDGVVRFTGDGEEFYVKSTKNDIAFLGELRLGGSYDVSCHWRAVAAYRAVAIAGIANSTDQIPSEFTNKEYVAMIDSDSSIIVHGVQVGAECRY